MLWLNKVRLFQFSYVLFCFDLKKGGMKCNGKNDVKIKMHQMSNVFFLISFKYDLMV